MIVYKPIKDYIVRMLIQKDIRDELNNDSYQNWYHSIYEHDCLHVIDIYNMDDRNKSIHSITDDNKTEFISGEKVNSRVKFYFYEPLAYENRQK